jgi:hypothetical protein
MSEFQLGDRVRLARKPAFLKTADPMPMLRPPDLVAVGEAGEISGQRPGGYWVVRFSQGSFLVDAPYLEPVGDD